jgi:hypothetical protein
MKSLKKIPEHLKYEESTLRASASVLFRKLIGHGLKPEQAARLICAELELHLISEHSSDLECLNS